MKHFFAVAAFGILAATAANAQTCGLTKVASYDMHFTDSGHVAVEITIGGQDKLLAVDTGAWFSYLTAEEVDAMKLPRRSMSGQFVAYDAYGRRTSEVATAPSIMLGPLEVDGVDFVVPPRGTSYGTKVSGLLGANVLKNFDLDFDFAAKKFNLFSQDHCPGQVVYWSAGGATKIPFKFNGSAITLPVQLDGHEFDAMLDSGAFASTISQPMANQIFNLSPESAGVDKTVRTGSNGSSWNDYTHTFNSLSFGGVIIPYPVLHLIPDKMGAAASADTAREINVMPLHLPDVLLGLAELRHLHLYISYKEKLLYVTAADAH
jgi:predicted aspartyl protease